MEENKIQVLIKIDSRNLIISINSDIFISDLTDWIKIDEGIGDKYAHAQGNYLSTSLIDEKGRYNYKFFEGTVATINEEEKEVLFPTPEPEHSPLETLQQENHLLKAQVNALTEQSEFQDELIAEIATVVYA